jgi:acyl-CoA thioesterase-1
MKNFSIALLAGLVSLTLATLSPRAAFGAEPPPQRTLLVFGDSLSAAYGIEATDGWVNLLAEKLATENPDYTVANASVSGETSTGGLARLPAALAEFQPAIVILELGGNDGLRGLPLRMLKDNLTAMVEMCLEAEAEVLLAGIQIPPNYGPRYTEPFYALFGEIAEEKELAFVPFLIDGIPQQPDLMQEDGIHPKAEAQFMILDNVWPVLVPMLSTNSD